MSSFIARARFNCLLGILFLFLVMFGSYFGESSPDDPGSCTCHDAGGYSLISAQALQFHIAPAQKFEMEFSATGSGVILEFNALSRDNEVFEVYPSAIVRDNELFDTNPAIDQINIIFILTSPHQEGEYKILFYARSPEIGGQPKLVCLEFTVTVGNPSFWSLNTFSRFLNHWNIYLGVISVSIGIIGSVLYQINRRNTQLHGILLSGSLILALINTIVILPRTFQVLQVWPNEYFSDWAIATHVILGILGISLGLFAFLIGLSGIKTKWPGYAALGCWAFNLIFGMIYWGVFF